MPFNLAVNLDDELHRRVEIEAALAGRTLDEELRKRVIEGSGGIWQPLTLKELVESDRLPRIELDLRMGGPTLGDTSE